MMYSFLQMKKIKISAENKTENDTHVNKISIELIYLMFHSEMTTSPSSSDFCGRWRIQ